MSNTKFRFATKEDTSLILSFIKELADYENLSNEVIADEKTLKEWIFDKNKMKRKLALRYFSIIFRPF